MIKKFGEQVGQLHVGGEPDRPVVAVRCDLGAERLGQRGDLLALQQAAGATQVELDDRGRPGLEHPGELVLRGQSLAGGDRHRALGATCAMCADVVGRHRLLEPQRVVRRDLAGDP